MSIHKEVTPEQIARIKLRYEARTTPVHDIAREEGVTPSQIYELRRRFEWPTRTELGKRLVERSIEQEKEIARALLETAPSRALPEKPRRDDKGRFAPRPGEGSAGLDIGALALRVQQALDRELTAAQARIEHADAAGADSRLRTLATLARALKTLQPIVEARRQDAEPDEPPIDIAELRRELARRLQRMRDEADQSEA